MGRLCGGAHEISGIKAPLFSLWVGDGGVSGVGVASGGMGVSGCKACRVVVVGWGWGV